MDINQKTGLLSGVPYEPCKINITFKVLGPYTTEGIEFNIEIEIEEPTVPIIMWKGRFVYLEAGIEYFDLKYFWILGNNLKWKIESIL